jgi:hypothetical protein
MRWFVGAGMSLSACLTLFGATSAHAADGVHEINQACVAAGCFPGDAPGFPVDITLQGSYQLTSNLSPTVTGQGAIRILATGVTLDLRGFTVAFCLDPPQGIACLAIGVATGIEGSGVTDTTLRNGVIQNFSGLGVDLGRRAHAERLNIRANGGAGLRVLQNSLVEHNRISFNGGSGISLGAGTAWGHNVLVTNNPDFTGTGFAVAANMCTGEVCARIPAERRRFYLTATVPPSYFDADGECDTGFRLAMLAEISNPSALTYDASRGESANGAFNSAGVGGWAGPECSNAVWNLEAWQATVVLCAFPNRVWCIED